MYYFFIIFLFSFITLKNKICYYSRPTLLNILLLSPFTQKFYSSQYLIYRGFLHTKQDLLINKMIYHRLLLSHMYVCLSLSRSLYI